jgi:hypothetical protein
MVKQKRKVLAPSSIAKESGSPREKGVFDDGVATAPVVLLLVAYYAWIVATPHVRFPILAEINLERFLAAAAIIAVLARSRVQKWDHRVAGVVLLLFLAMLLSYVLSDGKHIDETSHWMSEYWKQLVFFFAIAYGLRGHRELATFIIGIGIVSLLYQMHSWRDFLAGGSYVYQQGMKRMVGVWSGGGLGSANAWGSFALYSLPTGYYWFKVVRSRWSRYAALVLMAISGASIVVSGTRAAFVVGVAYLVYLARKQLFRPLPMLLLIATGCLLWTQVPQEYRARIAVIKLTGNSQNLSGVEATAAASGEARIQGLIDGFQLFLERPILGYGPGSSRVTRSKLHPGTPLDDLEQLHNLYGQLLAEIGLVGVLAFLSLVSIVGFSPKHGQHVAASPHPPWYVEGRSCYRSIMALLLLYGFFTHSLYQIHWLIVAGVVFAHLNVANTEPKKSVGRMRKGGRSE